MPSCSTGRWETTSATAPSTPTPTGFASGARLAEADSFVDAWPERLTTRGSAERGVTLSGGQKQRISLARAIVKRLSPSSSSTRRPPRSDNETEAAIQYALAEFARDRTLVVIAHRLSTIRHADWILRAGRRRLTVSEQGTHHEILLEQRRRLRLVVAAADRRGAVVTRGATPSAMQSAGSDGIDGSSSSVVRPA